MIRLFAWRGCPFPEDHADETFNRVARKISEGEEIRNAPAYVIGVARLLVLEILKAQSKQREALDRWQKFEVSEDTQSELRSECLQRCLDRLTPENRELIVQYYQGEKRAKIENRVLADSELDAVSGGKLLEAAGKGKVFHKVEIHGTG